MLELTAAQRDIYLEGQLFGRVINNIGGYEKILGELDFIRFVKARQILFQENDAYRLRFRELAGTCRPFFSDELPRDLRVIELADVASALTWMHEQFELPFRCISGSVFEDALIRLSSSEHFYYAKAHHLIMDGWGFALQMQRFLAVYERLSNPIPYVGKTAPSFLEYMVRQGVYGKSQKYLKSRNYWLARHEGTPGRLLTLAKEGTSSTGSRRVSTIIDMRLMETLRTTVDSAGVNLVVLMYATLYVYFSRSYQRNDITICSPVHNRRNAMDKAIIGSVVNVVAHRLVAEEDITFIELMSVIASIQRQDYRHGNFPLGDLVRIMREQTGEDTSPFNEILFNYQKLDFKLSVHGRGVETHYLSHSHERIPLTFVLCDYGDGQDVRLHLDYALSHFDEPDAKALLDRICGIMEQVGVDYQRPICDYRLLLPDEWMNQFATWQGPHLPLRHDICLHEFFEEQVSRTPAKTAVTRGTRSLTYAQLSDRADRLRDRLADEGITHGNLVGICHSRSVDLLVAMLAVLKSGATYVPLDPSYPAARIRYILDDSNVAFVVADAVGAKTLSGMACVLIHTDDIESEAVSARLPTLKKPLASSSPESPAYVIYTSGSTGEPKGVLIEHRNASAFVQWAVKEFSEEDLSCVLAGTSICFDLSLFELFVPLAVGGCVKIVDSVLALRAGDADELTLINTVPSAIRGLLEADSIPSSIRCINLAGESLRQELVDSLYARLGSIKVYDLYGPSETTTYSTFCLRTRGGEATIGRPIANTLAFVFDERGNPLPTGMVGELYIGGEGVSRGYLNRPQQTEQKYVMNPHTRSRLYRTGDLASLTRDGQLRYAGRKDGQEKIRGHRVETGEIESCLLEHPLVTDCVVVARMLASDADHKVLVAYVVTVDSHTGSVLFPAALNAFLRERLPFYMLPSHFVSLATLPLTPNGKVDRRALPEPIDSSLSAATYDEPTNDTEWRLSSLWESVLTQARIGIHENFFSRGGDSLLLLKLAAAIEGEFDVRVDMSLLFSSHSIEAQSRLIAHQMELAALLRNVIASEDMPSSDFIDL